MSKQSDQTTQIGHGSSGGTAPTLARAYEEHRGLLIWVLARLRDRGYRIELVDAMDLIHEFFATQYAGVAKRYRPERARFSSYLSVAFRNFVITTVLRAQDHEDRIERSFDLEGLALASEAPELSSDLTALKVGLEQISDAERRLLALRVGEGLSERAVARELGISRYGVRERTARALARLAAQVGERGIAESRDWPLVRMLTIEDRPIADAATALGMTFAQAHAAWNRTLVHFGTALTPAQPQRGGRSTMEKVDALDEARILRLLQECAKGEVSEELRQKLVENASDIEAYLLTDPDDDLIGEFQDPSVLLDVLGRAAIEREEGEDRALLDAMFDRAAHADEYVRFAVRTCVLRRLDPHRENTWLHQIDAVRLYGAIDAIPTLLHRWALLEKIENVVFVLDPSGVIEFDGNPVIAAETTVEEIRIRAQTDADEATQLLEWVCEGARRMQNLFVGALTKPSDARRIAVQITERPDEFDLIEYWGPAPSNAPPVNDLQQSGSRFA